MVMEGNELEGKIGDAGSYVVDVDAKGMVKATASYGVSGIKGGAFMELDLISMLEAAAKHTSNTLDDSAIMMIKGWLGRV